MRNPSEVLELALDTLHENLSNSMYMCSHLSWLRGQRRIDKDESMSTIAAISAAIEQFPTLAGYLRYRKLMPQHLSVMSSEYRVYQKKFYNELIIKLQAKELNQ